MSKTNDSSSSNSNQQNIDLLFACKNGDTKKVIDLIEKGASFNYANKDGWTPLHSACQYGHSEIAKILIDKGTDVNKGDKYGTTPLHSACQYGHSEIAKILIEKGAKVNYANEYGTTPLNFACKNGLSEIAKILIDKGADVKQVSKGGWSPLHSACQNGLIEIARILIEKEADVKQADKDGWTPLYAACRNGHSETAKILIEKGGDIMQGDKDGTTPLHATCENGLSEIAKILIEKGGDVKKGNKNGTTPLHLACLNGHSTTAKILIEKGADVNCKVTKGPHEGETPIQKAVINNHVAVINLLFESGADVACLNQAFIEKYNKEIKPETKDLIAKITQAENIKKRDEDLANKKRQEDPINTECKDKELKEIDQDYSKIDWLKVENKDIKFISSLRSEGEYKLIKFEESAGGDGNKSEDKDFIEIKDDDFVKIIIKTKKNPDQSSSTSQEKNPDQSKLINLEELGDKALLKDQKFIKFDINSTANSIADSAKIKTQIQKLARNLATNKTLLKLELEGLKIGDEEIKALANALEKNTTLQYLSLKDCGVQNSGAKVLFYALRRSSKSALIHVDLRGNVFAVSALEAMQVSLRYSQVSYSLTIDEDLKELIKSSIDKKQVFLGDHKVIDLELLKNIKIKLLAISFNKIFRENYEIIGLVNSKLIGDKVEDKVAQDEENKNEELFFDDLKILIEINQKLAFRDKAKSQALIKDEEYKELPEDLFKKLVSQNSQLVSQSPQSSQSQLPPESQEPVDKIIDILESTKSTGDFRVRNINLAGDPFAGDTSIEFAKLAKLFEHLSNHYFLNSLDISSNQIINSSGIENIKILIRDLIKKNPFITEINLSAIMVGEIFLDARFKNEIEEKLKLRKDLFEVVILSNDISPTPIESILKSSLEKIIFGKILTDKIKTQDFDISEKAFDVMFIYLEKFSKKLYGKDTPLVGVLRFLRKYFEGKSQGVTLEVEPHLSMQELADELKERQPFDQDLVSEDWKKRKKFGITFVKLDEKMEQWKCEMLTQEDQSKKESQPLIPNDAESQKPIEELTKDQEEKIKKESKEKDIASWLIKLEDYGSWSGNDNEEYQLTNPELRNEEHKLKILELLFIAVRISKGYFPNRTQMLALLFLYDAEEKNKRGNLGQIYTGEGKSVITSMFVIGKYLLHGKDTHIDITSSNSDLAEREFNEQRSFFDLFKIKTAFNIKTEVKDEKNSARDPMDRSCKVIYGDFEALVGFWIKKEFNQKDDDKQKFRPIEIKETHLFVDEADSQLFDNINISLLLTHEIPDFKIFDELLFKIFALAEKQKSEIEKYAIASGEFKKIADEIKGNKDLKKLVPEYFYEYFEDNIAKWAENACIAIKYKRDVEYRVIDEEAIKKNESEKTFEGQIKIMNNATGEMRESMEWSDALHYFLQIKEGMYIGDQGLPAIFGSYFKYFNSYKTISGVTGTLGNQETRDFLKHQYDVDYFEMPHHKKSQLRVSASKQFLGEITKEQLELILNLVINNTKESEESEEKKLILINPEEYKKDLENLIQSKSRENNPSLQVQELKLDFYLSDLKKLQKASEDQLEIKELLDRISLEVISPEISSNISKEDEIKIIDESKNRHAKAILDLATKSASNLTPDKQLPALIICPDIASANDLHERISKLNKGKIIANLYKVIDGKEALNNFLKEKNTTDQDSGEQALDFNNVIIATNIAGRGTDIKLTNAVNNAGGLRVIIAYYPDNFRNRDQIFGRTGRQGKKGIVHIVAWSKLKVKELVAQKKQQEEDIKKTIEVKIIEQLAKDFLVEKYFEVEKRIFGIDQKSQFKMQHRDYWAIWLNSIGSRFVDEFIKKNIDESSEENKENKKQFLLQNSKKLSDDFKEKLSEKFLEFEKKSSEKFLTQPNFFSKFGSQYLGYGVIGAEKKLNPQMLLPARRFRLLPFRSNNFANSKPLASAFYKIAENGLSEVSYRDAGYKETKEAKKTLVEYDDYYLAWSITKNLYDHNEIEAKKNKSKKDQLKKEAIKHYSLARKKFKEKQEFFEEISTKESLKESPYLKTQLQSQKAIITKLCDQSFQQLVGKKDQELTLDENVKSRLLDLGILKPKRFSKKIQASDVEYDNFKKDLKISGNDLVDQIEENLDLRIRAYFEGSGQINIDEILKDITFSQESISHDFKNLITITLQNFREELTKLNNNKALLLKDLKELKDHKMLTLKEVYKGDYEQAKKDIKKNFEEFANHKIFSDLKLRDRFLNHLNLLNIVDISSGDVDVKRQSYKTDLLRRSIIYFETQITQNIEKITEKKISDLKIYFFKAIIFNTLKADFSETKPDEIANKFTKYSNMIAKFLKESSCFEDSDSADLRKYESDLFHHFCKDKSECSDIKAVRPKKDFFSDEKNAQSLKRELTLAVKTHVILESEKKEIINKISAIKIAENHLEKTGSALFIQQALNYPPSETVKKISETSKQEIEISKPKNIEESQKVLNELLTNLGAIKYQSRIELQEKDLVPPVEISTKIPQKFDPFYKYQQQGLFVFHQVNQYQDLKEPPKIPSKIFNTKDSIRIAKMLNPIKSK